MTHNADWYLCSLKRVTPAIKRTGLIHSLQRDQPASSLSRHLLLILVFFVCLVFISAFKWWSDQSDGADFKHFWGGLFMNVKRIFISRAQLNVDSFNTFIVYGVSTECSFWRCQVQIGHIVSEELSVTGSWIIRSLHLRAAAEDDQSTLMLSLMLFLSRSFLLQRVSNEGAFPTKHLEPTAAGSQRAFCIPRLRSIALSFSRSLPSSVRVIRLESPNLSKLHVCTCFWSRCAMCQSFTAHWEICKQSQLASRQLRAAVGQLCWHEHDLLCCAVWDPLMGAAAHVILVWVGTTLWLLTLLWVYFLWTDLGHVVLPCAVKSLETFGTGPQTIWAPESLKYEAGMGFFSPPSSHKYFKKGILNEKWSQSSISVYNTAFL